METINIPFLKFFSLGRGGMSLGRDFSCNCSVLFLLKILLKQIWHNVKIC